jgi:hypothetical protein
VPATQKQTAKKRTPPTHPQQLHIHTFPLTRQDAASLAALAQACTDALGRRISRAGVLRALIRLTDQTIPLAAVVGAVEEELNAGRKWGRIPHQPPQSLRVND